MSLIWDTALLPCRGFLRGGVAQGALCVTPPFSPCTQGSPGALSPLKKKLRAENDFVKFDTPLSPKPVFFRKARSSAAAPAGSPAAQVRTRGFLGAKPRLRRRLALRGPGGAPRDLPGGFRCGGDAHRPPRGVEFVGVGRSGDAGRPAPVNQDLQGEEGPPRSRGGRLGRRRSGRCHDAEGPQRCHVAREGGTRCPPRTREGRWVRALAVEAWWSCGAGAWAGPAGETHGRRWVGMLRKKVLFEARRPAGPLPVLIRTRELLRDVCCTPGLVQSGSSRDVSMSLKQKQCQAESQGSHGMWGSGKGFEKVCQTQNGSASRRGQIGTIVNFKESLNIQSVWSPGAQKSGSAAPLPPNSSPVWLPSA